MTEVLASLHNPLVKTAAALKERKYRDAQGLFIVEGIRLCEELAASGWQAELCFHTAAVRRNERAASVLQALAARRCRLVEVTEPVFAKLGDTRQPQGLLAVVRKKSAVLADIATRGETPPLVILDGIQDPGNAGTLIRTADAAGCRGVVFLKGCVDLYSPKVVRAAMGSLFHLPTAEGVGASELAAALAGAGITLTATALAEATPYWAADFTRPQAIVFGNEGQGVSVELLTAAANRIAIPLYGRAESLNVAASAAVILYEAARQRRHSCNLPGGML